MVNYWPYFYIISVLCFIARNHQTNKTHVMLCYVMLLCFGQIVVFQAKYDEIELQKIAITSFQWRHHHYLTKNGH